MREKIDFRVNVPVRVAFESAGTLSAGRYGDQYQYFLAGERIMWVPPIVHAEINRLQIQAGEEFDICKQESQDGRKKVVRWHVGVIGDAFDRHMNQSPHGQIAVDRERQPVSTPPAARPQETSPRPPEITAREAQPQIISRKDRMTALLVDCFGAIADAATKTGRNLDGEEFQKILSTMVIDDQKREENRLKYGGSLPPAQPRPNGATTWNH